MALEFKIYIEKLFKKSKKICNKNEKEETALELQNLILRLEQTNKELMTALYYHKHYDSVTGLPNHTHFTHIFQNSLQQAQKDGTKVAMLFLNLDNFKEINDSLGYKIGDKVLKIISKKLRYIIKVEESLSRFGGDEFIIMIHNLKNAHDASNTASEIMKALSIPVYIDKNELFISSSIGISIYPDDDMSTHNLFKYANTALHKAKSEGKNNFQFYNSDMTALACQRLVMETALRNAIQNEEFVVYYQVQMNGITHKVIGMEALVRWKHPTMGLIFPAKFIPLAESTGLIVQLDRLVMKIAMTQVFQWYKDGLNPGRLAINLAIQQLKQEDFISILTNLIKDTRCKAQWLEFEVTEGQIMTHPEKAINILKQINDLGIQLAVDDFGTGYSSLSYLKRLPINKLKIDQAFVKDLPFNEEDSAIVKAIIALAKSLNLKIIAEGVERKEQENFMLKNGCDNIQGYLYSQALPADEFKNKFL